MIRLAVICATVGYCGYSPKASGTVGSVVGLVIYCVMSKLTSTSVELLTIAVICALGVWSSNITTQHFKCVDPKPVVIDEVAGMLVTFALIPVGGAGLLVGFVLFRIFDIAKPFPMNRLERIPRGWGIMADDLGAGLFANIVLRILWWSIPEWIT